MLEIRESQIEDILATQLDTVQVMLKVKDGLSLINRQKRLPSGGILDLLYLSPTALHLCELKAVKSEKKFCDQVVNYKIEIEGLQRRLEMPTLPIIPYLVCPDFAPEHIVYCHERGVTPIQFSPFELLQKYYLRVQAIARLTNLKPSNHGLWNLHLLNRLLYQLDNALSSEQLAEKAKISKSTVNSYLRLSTEIGLTNRKPSISLTDLGRKYISAREVDKPVDYLGEKQVDLLKEYIIQNPFFSPAIYGIYTSVESVFLLSKNMYPVPLERAIEFFTTLAGKESEWADKARKDAFIMYTNYSIDLGLLAKVDRDYYLTPAGVKFILLLELNKSILVSSQVGVLLFC